MRNGISDRLLWPEVEDVLGAVVRHDCEPRASLSVFHRLAVVLLDLRLARSTDVGDVAPAVDLVALCILPAEHGADEGVPQCVESPFEMDPTAVDFGAGDLAQAAGLIIARLGQGTHDAG